MVKRLMTFLAVFFLVVFTAAAIWGDKHGPRLTAPTPPKDGSESIDYLITRAPTVFPNAHCGEISILSPYDTCIGCSYVDAQHRNRIPRMNANDYQDFTDGHGLHFTFTRYETVYRLVNYTYWDPPDGWTDLPALSISDVDFYDVSYTSMDILDDSRAVVCYDLIPGYTVLSIEPHTPGAIEMRGNKYWYDIPDWAYPLPSLQGRWPSCAVDRRFNRIHIAMREGGVDPGIKWLGYIRCEEIPGDSLMCQAPGKESVRLGKETHYGDIEYLVTGFDSSGTVSQIVVTSKSWSTAQNVALVWTSLAESETDSSQFELCNDVFYIESSYAGDDWFNTGFPPRINITKYGPADHMRAYGDISAVYDLNDYLHIFWHTHYYDPETKRFDFDDVTLRHWSEGTVRICDEDTFPANKVQVAKWEARPGANNSLISKMQSGVGIVEGENANYLYLQWTQFNPQTESKSGYSQGDIYVTLSTDNGMTWVVPVNTTNSTVSDCEPGNCASDHWSSMAERVDTCIYMQWIYDLDPGEWLGEEGERTNNPVLYRCFPVNDIPIENRARIDWSPSGFVTPYIHCPTNGSVLRNLVIENIGTATLSNIQLAETAGWLSVYPNNIASIAAGGCPVNVTLIITGQGAEEFYVDSIHVTSNDQVGNNDFYIRLHVVMSDVYVAPNFATCNNLNMYVGFSNLGNLGNQVDTAGYYLYRDVEKPSFLYDASVLLAFTAGNNDSLVGRYIFNEHYLLPERNAIATNMGNLKTIVIDAEFSPTTPQAPLPWHHRWWYWTIRTRDYIFYSGDRPNNNEQYVTLRYITLYYNNPPPWWPDITTPTSITPHYLGMALDINAPSTSGSCNQPGQDQDRRLSYLQGYGGGINENYRMGIAQRDTCFWVNAPWAPIRCCWPDPNSVPEKDWPFAMHILRSDSVIYPYEGYNDVELYKWMSTVGISIQPDTLGDTAVTDYNIVTTGRVIPAGNFPPSDTYEVAYALVVSDRFEIDGMNSNVDMIICGNVNRDNKVDITDVVYFVNYIFRGGPELWRYMGDANGDGELSISDVVYLVNYVIKSGPPPLCSWNF